MARILVVEDEAPLRRIIVLNLVRRGHTVIEAEGVASAQEALAAFARQFDLILLDLNLPDRTGWDLLRALEQTNAPPYPEQAERARAPAVIIITAVRPVRSRLEAFHPVAVLLKPFPIEALLRLIQRVLGASSVELAEDAEDQYNPSEKERT
ncbi:MAG TPA: response regulator [Ktedonobacterales bacterium]|jgi:CheY-like chemotaxis protein